MLDKGRQNNIDKAFINASWKKMNVVLDDELPRPKNNDRLLVRLLTLLLLLSFLSLAWISYRFFNLVPSTALTKERIIYQQLYEDKIDNDQMVNVPISSTRPNVLGASNNQQKSFIRSLEDSNFINNSNNEASFKGQESTIDKIAYIPSISQTIELKINQANIAVSNSEMLVSNEEKLKKLSNVDLSLGLITFVSNNQDFSGYGFSSGVNFPLGKRIGLNTGVAVNFISRGYTIFPFLDKDNPQSNFGKTRLNEEDTYYSGLKSFKQVYFPLGINYHISKYLTLNSGLKFRYTFAEDIDRILEVQARQRVGKSESVANTFFNQTNIGLSAGFTVAVSDKLSFYVDSEWGLNSLTNSKVLSNPTSRRYDLNLINLSTNYKF